MDENGSDDDAPVEVLSACQHGLTVREQCGDHQHVERYGKLADGQALPVGSELYSFEQSKDGSVRKKLLYSPHKGPSRCSSAKYRQGFDAIFGRSDKRARGQA